MKPILLFWRPALDGDDYNGNDDKYVDIDVYENHEKDECDYDDDYVDDVDDGDDNDDDDDDDEDDDDNCVERGRW